MLLNIMVSCLKYYAGLCIKILTAILSIFIMLLPYAGQSDPSHLPDARFGTAIQLVRYRDYSTK